MEILDYINIQICCYLYPYFIFILIINLKIPLTSNINIIIHKHILKKIKSELILLFSSFIFN